MTEKEEIKECAEKLRSFCKRKSGCIDCPFADDDFCKFYTNSYYGNTAPRYWEFPWDVVSNATSTGVPLQPDRIEMSQEDREKEG